jgi:prophage regulatory protein
MSEALERFFRMDVVENIVGIKRTKIKEMIAAGVFPQPISLSDGGRAVAWRESELAAWQRSRIAKRRTA